MPYRCSKVFHFCAAHALTQLPKEHKCHNLHGHNYEVTITLQSEWLNLGMVVDFGEITEFWEAELKPVLDHQNLNDNADFLGSPTAEALARWVYGKCREKWAIVYSVRVQETPTCWAEYIRDDTDNRKRETPYHTFIPGTPDRLL